MRNQCLVASLLLMLSASDLAIAASNISVQGLFKNKAVLMIDGKRSVLSVGKTSREGVKLLSIKGEQIQLEIAGKKHSYRLGDFSAISTQYTQAKQSEVVISQNSRGLYSTTGSINGVPVSMLVDTGANVVALNASHAKRLNIDFKKIGQPTMVSTASKQEKAYRVTLDKVAVGDIQLHNVMAVVMTGGFPETVLLGMSFLGNVEVQRNGNVMRLKKKW